MLWKVVTPFHHQPLRNLKLRLRKLPQQPVRRRRHQRKQRQQKQRKAAAVTSLGWKFQDKNSGMSQIMAVQSKLTLVKSVQLVQHKLKTLEMMKNVLNSSRNKSLLNKRRVTNRRVVFPFFRFVVYFSFFTLG